MNYERKKNLLTKKQVLKNAIACVIFLFWSIMSHHKHFMILYYIIWFCFLCSTFFWFFDWVVLGTFKFPIFVNWPTVFSKTSITNNRIDPSSGRWPTDGRRIIWWTCSFIIFCVNMNTIKKFIWATSSPSLLIWRTINIFFCKGITSIQSNILTKSYPPVTILSMPPHTLSIHLINWLIAFKRILQWIKWINPIIFRWHVFYFNFTYVSGIAITQFNRIFIVQNWRRDSFTITIIKLWVWNILIATLLVSML